MACRGVGVPPALPRPLRFAQALVLGSGCDEKKQWSISQFVFLGCVSKRKMGKLRTKRQEEASQYIHVTSIMNGSILDMAT